MLGNLFRRLLNVGSEVGRTTGPGSRGMGRLLRSNSPIWEPGVSRELTGQLVRANSTEPFVAKQFNRARFDLPPALPSGSRAPIEQGIRVSPIRVWRDTPPVTQARWPEGWPSNAPNANRRDILGSIASKGRTGYRRATLHSEEMGRRGYASRKALPKPSRLSRLTGKAIIAGGLVGGGLVASELIDNQGRQAKNYYGQKEYDRRFGGGFDLMSNAAIGVGIGLGAASLGSLPNFVKPSKWKAYGKAKAVINRSTKEFIPTTAKRAKRLAANDPTHLGFAGRLGLVGAVGAVGTVAGGTIIAGDPVAAITGGLALSAVASTFIHKKTGGKYGALAFVRNYPAATGIAVGSAVAGGAFGYNRPIYSAGEGNIISAEHENQSVVSRMNFSTANLVQSLHKNRKVT